jgi:hypothetical protein
MSNELKKQANYGRIGSPSFSYSEMENDLIGKLVNQIYKNAYGYINSREKI